MIRSNDVIPPPAHPFIRRAGPADVDAIYALELEAFVDVWDKATFAEALSYYPTTFFVAVSNGQVTGFIVGALEDTGENIYGHICNFAVSSRFQRRGIGRALVIRLEHQFALEMATGSQLEVRESNAPAQNFYRRLGYENIFQIGGYYKNGEAALVMMKWFRF
ncbi:MAG: ribosomal protein S18-alanine N-acetyltransferase [Methanoregula sp.]|jgi:ribosomal-protein-alanine N-acetyltransferase|uniref:ribosomal protein S18-alanine N-acetyltransferase n=1 Tax=Methanoregula sp. TaxID=2052170 RepID=UPI003D104117